MKLADLLRTMDIFERLGQPELDTIARLLRERRLKEGEVLCRQGEVGDAMYIVTGGRIRIWTQDRSGHERALSTLNDGQFFGEMALLTGEPRSASATAETECRVLELQKQAFDELIDQSPDILREMLKVIAVRTVETDRRLGSDSELVSAGPSGGGIVLVVFSPRGGAGKTTISINLAAVLARLMPERIALVDLDLNFGHTALLLNSTPRVSLAEVPPDALGDFDRQQLSRYVDHHPAGIHLLVGASRPEEGEMVTGEHVKAALRVMRRQYACTIVDTGTSLREPVVAAMEMADRVLVVGTPDVGTLHDVRECQRLFGEVLHVNKAKLQYVLNHPYPFKGLSREQYERALNVEVRDALPHAGEVAMRAVLQGEPIARLNPGNAFVRDLEKVALSLVPAEVGPVKARSPRQVVIPVPARVEPMVPRSGGVLRLFRRSVG